MTSTSRGQQKDMLTRLNFDPNAFQPYCFKQANNEPPLPRHQGPWRWGKIQNMHLTNVCRLQNGSVVGEFLGQSLYVFCFIERRGKMHIGGLPESDTQCRKVNVSPSLKGLFFLSQAQFQRKFKEKIHWVIAEKMAEGKSERNKAFGRC